ncbi:MAG: apolipoprotein N-acyltransferase [Phycisphaerae bacterium]
MKRRTRSTKRTPTPPKASTRVTGALEIESHRTVLLLLSVTLLLMSLIFAPISWWPLSFVCLVPWLIVIGGASHAPRVYFYSYVLGLLFFLVNMRWLYAATGWGYLALSAYMAIYFPFVASPIRHVVRRRRWPLAVAFPFVWTGSELLRGVVMSGFPWFFLSHSVHRVLTFIQVSDLLGAYGVTFMLAAFNGMVADLIFASASEPWITKRRLNLRGARISIAFALLVTVAVVLYGRIQLSRDTIEAGPKIAVIQGDYPNTVGVPAGDGLMARMIRFLNGVYMSPAQPHDNASDPEKLTTYASMLQAAAEHEPDLYLLPETPWLMALNPEWREFSPISRTSFSMFAKHAAEHNAVIVTGSTTVVPTPHDLLADQRRYNSATVFRPDGSEPDRYDKIHLVYFGEVVPFRFGRLRPLYFLLNRLMPFSGPNHDFEFSLFRGEAFKRFALDAPSRGGRDYRFGIPICYEDVMPYVSREFVCGGSNVKQADFLLNISNDGWFDRGIQQPQHLAVCVFRAVENRVGIARAVNTGVSGFIQPTGRIHDVVTPDPASPWPGNCGYAVANVGVDARYSLYSRYGDWFAWGCALVWLVLFIDYWIVRARTRSDQ